MTEPAWQEVLHFIASVPGVNNTTTTREVLRNLLLNTDGKTLARGHLWEIKAKHLGAGVYRVTLADEKKCPACKEDE